jgi:2'-5' RNA ligase
MRLFFAIVPPPDVQRAAFRVIESLREDGDGVAWVRQENLHFTMRFLGEVGDSAHGAVARAGREAAAGHPSFEATLGAAGAFPEPRRARVLWLGLAEGAAPMGGLAGSLDAALDRIGFAREERDFSAHLTLGRVREPHDDWTARLARVGASVEGIAFRVDRLALVQSRLARGGSVYTVMDEAPLAG